MMLREILLAVVMCTPACAQTPTAAQEVEPTPDEQIAIASCGGVLKQGGLVICKGAPGEAFTVAGIKQVSDAAGSAQFGIATDAPAVIGWSAGDGSYGDLAIAPRKDEFRTIEGFDCDKVDARSDAQKAHAARSWEIKQAAFASMNPGAGALKGFIKPAAVPASSPFGPTRKYIGVSKVTGKPCESTSVHQGYDMAAPVGTPVVAPADGTVILADPDLYYEGGAVFLDHGHGLTSVFMHLSEVEVKPGDVVKRGVLLAKTGNTGRTTGPHLHWAVKWRNAASTDRSGDFYIDPELLLGLPVTD
jgi:murein DD-endopeptidase MepM/ murein hydrolase activator NlpD